MVVEGDEEDSFSALFPVAVDHHARTLWAILVIRRSASLRAKLVFISALAMECFSLSET
jgi:hypothetical protein